MNKQQIIESLVTIRRSIIKSSSVIDTIWINNVETVVDRIDYLIEEIGGGK